MIIDNIIFFVIILLCFLVLILGWHCYKLKRKFDKQSIWGIKQYLDKKFICKLLSNFLVCSQINILQILLDEIMHYFCLDFIAIRVTSHGKVVTHKSALFNKIYTDNAINQLLNNVEIIKENVGHATLKSQNHRQFIVFKHNEIHMIVASEPDYLLPLDDINTLTNDIIMLLECGMNVRAKNQ